MARLLEDGLACQQHLMKANARLAPHPPRSETAVDAAAAADPPGETRLSA